MPIEHEPDRAGFSEVLPRRRATYHDDAGCRGIVSLIEIASFQERNAHRGEVAITDGSDPGPLVAYVLRRASRGDPRSDEQFFAHEKAVPGESHGPHVRGVAEPGQQAVDGLSL